MGVYHALAHDPGIDTRRVYLFGASAETRYLSECVTQSPGLWKGIILLNPTQLPDFSKSPPFQSRPKILISAGGEEHEADRLKKYQADALNWGVLVDYVIHPGEPHHLVGNAGELERTKAMMHFVFEE
jgi:predicted esterase